jgi:hypothetical protein
MAWHHLGRPYVSHDARVSKPSQPTGPRDRGGLLSERTDLLSLAESVNNINKLLRNMDGRSPCRTGHMS